VPTLPKPLYHAQPSSSAAALYTVPADTQTVIRHIRCVNPDTADHTLDLYHYASGGTANDASRISETIDIPAGTTFEEDVYIPMNPTDVLAGKADANSAVTLFVGGAEVT
jgi:hypothetical protein